MPTSTYQPKDDALQGNLFGTPEPVDPPTSAATREPKAASHDLSDDELSKVHLRHMVGGRLPQQNKASEQSRQELLYRFEFPERPGALMRFVNALHSNWSISIFHYRNHGADVGRIVVGVLVSPDDLESWQAVLRDLGYPSWEETSNPAYRIFLGS